MNYKFLRVLAASLVTSMIVGGSLSTLYFINGSKTSTITPDTTDDEDDDKKTKEQIECENAKAKLAENLASSNINFKDLLFKVDGIGSKANNQILLSFNGAADYKAFIDTRKDNDASNDVVARLNGNVNIKYNEVLTDTSVNPILDESMIINANGNGKLYLDLNWADTINGEDANYTRYSLSGKFLTDVLDFLPTIGKLTNNDLSSVTDIVDKVKSIDVLPLIPTICGALMSFSSDTDLNQTPEIVDGHKIYTYNLLVKQSLLSSVGIDQDINVVLKCNENGLLTYIALNPLTVSGITLSFESNTEMSLDSEYVDNTDINGDYNNLDCTTNILTTIASLVDEKAFNTNFSLSFKEEENGVKAASREITGAFKGNLKNAISINDGAIYDITLGGEKDLYTKVNVRYEENKTYFNVHNQLATGFIENSTIDDLSKNIVGTLANDNQEQTNEALDAVNNVLKGEAIYDIMKGNWNAYKKIIKNLTVEGAPDDESCKMKLEISAKGLYSKLLDKSFYLELDLSNGKFNGVSIVDLPINESKDTSDVNHVNYVSLSLSLKDYVETNVSEVYGDLSTYANFKIVSPIFNSISQIANTKQIGTSYSFSYTKKDETTPMIEAAGNLNADLNKIDSMDFGDDVTFDSAIDVIKGKNLGLYQLNLNASVNGVPHNAKLTYQNQGLYLDYHGYSESSRTRMSLTQGKIFDIITFAEGLINSNSSTESTDTKSPFDDMSSTINDILNLTDGKIWTILNSTYIDELKPYISIKNGTTEDTLVIDINTKAFNSNTENPGQISITLDTVDKGENPSLLSISGSFEDQNTGLFTFGLSFDDYKEFSISEDEITNYYKEMNTTVDSVLGIIEGVSSSFKVNGVLENPRQ